MAAPRAPGLALLLLLVAAVLAPRGAAAGVIDISVSLQHGLPVWEQARGLPRNWRSRHSEISEGDVVNQSVINIDCHTGTHIDAPRHFLDDGSTIEALPLDVLMGPAWVVEVPPGANVTAAVLRELQVPRGAARVLFKTDNTRRRLLRATPFASDYAGLDSGAAAELVSRGVALVGIDYLSIGALHDIVDTHKALFKGGVVVVEGLMLEGVPAGEYNLACLPVKLAGSDGAPARCVLQTLPAACR